MGLHMRPQGSARTQRPPCSPAVLLAAAAVVLLLTAPQQVAAQQVSPLAGQNSPDLSTTEVFFSAYLDRLLNVNEILYRHEGIFYFYITWVDSTAFETVRASTERMKAGQPCLKQCTDFATNLSCCDGMYLPSFWFRNAHSFTQDRQTGYKIYALPNGTVLWQTYVHGIFYQPMDLRHFPFDSFDLLVSVEFTDTSDIDHPGVSVQTSSAGTKLYTVGLSGDPVSGWAVTGIRLQTETSSDAASWFLEYSTVPSNPDDPLPLAPAQPGDASVFAGNFSELLGIYVTTERFWQPQMLNTVLPVMLVGLLSFVIFGVDCRKLSARLGILVTLFLSLMAISIVLASTQPWSSYVLPTQQFLISTYVLLAIEAVSSILTNNVAQATTRAQKAKNRQAAYKRFKTSTTRRTHKKAEDQESSLGFWDSEASKPPSPRPPGTPSTASSESNHPLDRSLTGMTAGSNSSRSLNPDVAILPTLQEEADAPPPGQEGKQQESACAWWFGCCSGWCTGWGTGWCSGCTGLLPALRMDEWLDDHLAVQIDLLTLAFCLVGWTVAAILIFTLQSGYIQLFPDSSA